MANVVISDEANFQMNGKVSNWNIRRYAPMGHSPEDFIYDVPQSQEKLAVWAALVGNNRIIGPYFFNGNVNSERYLEMINHYALPETVWKSSVNDRMGLW